MKENNEYHTDEIKFRGKSKVSEKWVFGFYMIDYLNGKPIHRIYETHNENRIRFFSEIIPETLGRFTGWLTGMGKIGEEIYHGDIIEFHASYSSKPCGRMEAEVVWLPEYGKFVLRNEHGDYDPQEETDEFYYDRSIVGSIYDNL